MQKAAFKVSENDCQEILSIYLKKKTKFQINNILVEPISNSGGLLGEHYILKLTIQNKNGSTDLSFFLKSLNQENEIINKFVKSGNLFNKEVCCYKFFEKLRIEYPTIDLSFCAKYYYSRDNEIIVLENLSDSGYKVVDFSRLDINHMKVALTAIAKFHASSIIFEETVSKDLKRRYSLTEDFAEYLQEGLFKDDKNYVGYKYVQSGLQALHTIIDQLPCKLSHNDFKQKVLDLTIQAYKETKQSHTIKNVWSHGDLWVKNLMFRYKDDEPVDCKIIDYQFLRYLPPALDVLEMIYDSEDKKMFQNHLDTLLMHYFECLKNELERIGLSVENILSFDEFYCSVEKLIPVAKLIKSIHKSMGVTNYNEICYGDPSQQVIQTFTTQEAYRVLMTSLIEELENVVMNIP